MMTIDEVLNKINSQCPPWLKLYRIIPLANGTIYGAQFETHANQDNFSAYITICFDSLDELYREVMETLPTLTEDKMNIFGTDLFKYISGDMLVGKSATKTIARVVLEELSNGSKTEQKPVVYFDDGKKGWVLNKSSARALAEVLGAETDNWKGARVTLKSEPMLAFGKQMQVIRVVKVLRPGNGKAEKVTDEPTQEDLFDSVQ